MAAPALTWLPDARVQSAALGIAIAGALSMGYANIFVTSPSPENLRTLFEFVFKGLDALGYKEHIDYDLVESTNPAFGAHLLAAPARECKAAVSQASQTPRRQGDCARQRVQVAPADGAVRAAAARGARVAGGAADHR
jgi:hypothetical protein